MRRQQNELSTRVQGKGLWNKRAESKQQLVKQVHVLNTLSTNHPKLNGTPSIPHNLSPFDLKQILKNIIKNKLKKLEECGSYFYNNNFIIKYE